MDLKNTETNGINVKPSFGSSASFSCSNKSFTFGDNYTTIMPDGINSLKMKLNLNFNDLIDSEALDLISFFQNQFYYKIQDYNNLGYFNNKRVPAFSYSPFYPYKTNFFNCVTYNHEKVHYDVNSVTASLEATSASSLSSVDSFLASYDITAIGSLSSPIVNASLHNTSDSKTILLNSNSYLYHPTSYKSFRVLSDDISVSPGATQTINIDNSHGLFESFNDGLTNQTNLRSSIFIKKPQHSSFFPYSPITTENDTFGFSMFDFRPNQQTNLSHSPKFKKTTISDSYSKYNLYGFNPNLFNMQLSFNGRSNEETKRILLFLESHLGYKKFGFHIQKDYTSSPSNDLNNTPHRKSMSLYYCPEWTHTFTYYNSHDITATFIECPSF